MQLTPFRSFSFQNNVNYFLPSVRERRFGQDEEQAGPNHLHGRAVAGPPSQLPHRFEPGRTRPREDRSNHGPFEEGDAGVVPEQSGETEEIHHTREATSSTATHARRCW